MEIGEGGTPHFQGYCVFENAIRLNSFRTMLGGGHIYKREGFHSQAKHYVTKPHLNCVCKHCVPPDKPVPITVDGPWFYGNDDGIPEGQGQRSDLSAVKRKIEDGISMVDLFDQHFNDCVRYSRGFKEYKRLKTPERNWEMVVIVCWGPTGSGKTSWVYNTFGGSLFSVPQPKSSGCYWDDYDNQETVLVDEMYGSRFSHGFLLQLCDNRPFTVPVHGSSVQFTSKRIVFCSNDPPDMWYQAYYDKRGYLFNDPLQGALYRRMTQGDSCILLFSIQGGECGFMEVTDGSRRVVGKVLLTDKGMFPLNHPRILNEIE